MPLYFIERQGILEKKFIEGVSNEKKYELSDNKFLVKNYLKNLNFTLTKAQKNVITDIYKELDSAIFINRLIQGEVGS